MLEYFVMRSTSSSVIQDTSVLLDGYAANLGRRLAQAEHEQIALELADTVNPEFIVYGRPCINRHLDAVLVNKRSGSHFTCL